MNIHIAAAEGQSETCERLLREGEDVNRTDELGWSPLMHAVRNGHSELADRLLFYGADVCLSNQHGLTAFTVAVIRCKSMLGVLYDSLTPNLRLVESNNALQVACVKGLYDAARWILLNTSVQVNYLSQITGMTPLHLSIIGRYHHLVELLLSFGAEANILTGLGQDGLALADISDDKHTKYLLGHANSPKKASCFHFSKIENLQFENIDPIYTENKILLDINGDIVLKNSPSRPVFKTKKKLHLDFSVKTNEMTLLGSPSLRSVFLSPRQLITSPQKNNCSIEEDSCFDADVGVKQKLVGNPSDETEFFPRQESCNTPDPKYSNYSLYGLISPRPNPLIVTPQTPTLTPNKGKKRKLFCVSWLKQFTKRRTQSLGDSGNCVDFDSLKKGSIDFAQVLYGLGLDDFYPIFKEQELDMWTFLTLTSEDLNAMGVQDEKAKEKILMGIETLRKAQL